MGATDLIDGAGFIRKFGASYVWGASQEIWSIDFSPNQDVFAWQVDRSTFDHLLLENAKENGVEVLEGAVVTDVGLTGPLVDHVVVSQNGIKSTISAKYYVDASGQSSVLASKLHRRIFDRRFRNLAVYSYYKPSRVLDDPNAGDILISSVDSGWLWHIPLAGAVASVGWVGGDYSLAELRRLGRERFLEMAISSCPTVRKLLEGARRVAPVRIERDWSYSSADDFGGPNHLLVGDAACFIDPVLSSGVFLAMHGAYIGAICLNTALSVTDTNSLITPSRLLEFYSERYRQVFNSFRDMADFWYHGQRSRDSWFWKARQVTGGKAAQNVHSQRAFVHLVAGFHGNSALQKLATAATAGFSSHELPILFENLASHILPGPLKPITYFAQTNDFPRELEEKRLDYLQGVLSDHLPDSKVVRSPHVQLEETLVEREFQWVPGLKAIPHSWLRKTLDHDVTGYMVTLDLGEVLKALSEPWPVMALKDRLLQFLAPREADTTLRQLFDVGLIEQVNA